jgi:uncharacterized membrane protein
MNDEPNDPANRDDRLDELERQVEGLQQDVRILRKIAQQESDEGPLPGGARRSRPKRQRPKREKPRKPLFPKVSISPEELLKWSGIGLVLIAMVLLFKYAVEVGWLTPGVRVGIGFIVGIVLIALGLRVRDSRPRFGQVLQGGGIATYYITLFAAFQVLDVVPFESAFVGMAATTAIALTMAVRQDDAGLAIFGLLGGLATPFLLYTGQSDVGALVSYTALVLTATTSIYLWKGWRSMLYVTVVGGWTVFLIAADALGRPTAATFSDHLAVQMSAVFVLLAFWVAPVVRSLVVVGDDDPVTRLEERHASSSTGLLAALEQLFRNTVHPLIVITPLIAALITDEAWRLSDMLHGIILIGLSALFAAVATYLTTIDRHRLAYTHWLTVGILMTVGLMLMLDGDALIAGLAVEALILHVLASRLDDRWPRFGAHALALILAAWMSFRLDLVLKPPPLINLTALSDLVVIAVGLSISFAIKGNKTAILYRAAAYLGFLVWLSRELEGFDNGQAFVTVAWSLCGVILLVTGLKKANDGARLVGLATLALVVGKLFLVDLTELDQIWRIVLFLGVGAGFLLLAWFVPGLWKKTGSGEHMDSPS